jgi:hypothetical protein
MMLDKFQSWMYKKHPRLLTFFYQFTIIEWLVLLGVAGYIFLMEA